MFTINESADLSIFVDESINRVIYVNVVNVNKLVSITTTKPEVALLFYFTKSPKPQKPKGTKFIMTYDKKLQ